MGKLKAITKLEPKLKKQAAAYTQQNDRTWRPKHLGRMKYHCCAISQSQHESFNHCKNLSFLWFIPARTL